jgi:parallel beta-helix repeat protein
MFGKMLRPVVTLMVLSLISMSLFATMMHVSQSKAGSMASTVLDTALPMGSDEWKFAALHWNVTTIGMTASLSVGNGVIFKDNYVFWRTINSTDFAITAFSLSNYTFKDVWNSNNSFPDGGGEDMKIINDSLFALYEYSIEPFGSCIAMIWSSDLSTWTRYFDFTSTLWGVESFCQYAGPGPYNGVIEYGGYVFGTAAEICAWNSTSNSENVLFTGTMEGSDDVCFLTMFNSTCMIGGDCGPSNIIYTNDGENWTDEISPSSQPAYTPQYPFCWGWGVYVSNGTAYVAEEGSMWALTGPYAPLSQGGLMTWSGVGTTAAFDYNMTMESIADGLIGGSAGWLTSSGDYGGPAVIYEYDSEGTLGALVWQSSYDGTVKDLNYDPGSTAWYAIALSIDLQSATILRITINGSSSPMTIVVPDDYPTIQSAVDAASRGDTVYVRAGTYYENVQVNKTMSLVGENPQDTVVDGGDVQDVISVLADHVNITGLAVCDDQPALKGGWDYADISLSGTSCNIFGNVLTDSLAGVDFSASANNNRITENEISNNDWGIYTGTYDFVNSGEVIANSDVMRNNITDNSCGISLRGNCDRVSGNNIANNEQGILLDYSANNIITGNDITANNEFGIGLFFSSNNEIYHNNIENPYQVLSWESTNIWDSGYPSGGNYWSNYAGTDLYNGPNQNVTGSDGISDTPYVIDANNVDNYPLMGSFSRHYSNVTQTSVSCISNSTVSAFQLGLTMISFDISGEPDTTGFCTVTVPHSTLPPPYTIEIDGNSLSYSTIYEDATRSVLYFTYEDSTHEVTVTDTAASTSSGGCRTPYMD